MRKTSKSYSKRSQQKQQKKNRKRKQKQKKIAVEEAKQKKKQTNLIYMLHSTISHNFPQLFQWMREIDDCRKKASEYELAAHLTACLAMFLFKTESRNGYNQERKDLRFRKNYKKLFKFPMPHADSVHNVISRLDEEQVEMLKVKMVKVLLKRKAFHKSRFRDKWFCVAVDGSGVVSFTYKHCEQCLHRTSKKGKTTYFHSVLDARLVTASGFSISIATQWIENPEDGNYEKQDCELKAFKKLAAKLKKTFIRLPIVILGDGLYPNQGVFEICKLNRWEFIITLKEGSLTTVWTEVDGLTPLQFNNYHKITSHLPGKQKLAQFFHWITEIDYNGYSLNWLECVERETRADGAEIKKVRFVHITSFSLEKQNIVKTSLTGRMRWKIENEGFNTLKNGGYKMKHKYDRKNYHGLKNYFQFMQMGHLINQLMVKSSFFDKTYLQGPDRLTLQKLWAYLVSAMEWSILSSEILLELSQRKSQFRFAN